MKLSTKEIRSQIDRCQVAEAVLLQLRQRLEGLRAELAQGETKATAQVSDAGSFEKLVDKLDGKRREISEVEYRAELHAKNVRLLRSNLQQVVSDLAGHAHAVCIELRAAVMAELSRRIAPFLTTRAARYAIPQAHVVPLNKPLKLCAAIASQADQLASDCTGASLYVVSKYEQLVTAIAAVEGQLGIAVKR